MELTYFQKNKCIPLQSQLKESLILLILCLLHCLTIQAQLEQKTISINQAIEDSNLSDSIRIDALSKFGRQLINKGEFDSSRIVLSSIKLIAQEDNYALGQYEYLFWKGYQQFRQGEYNRAIHNLKEAYLVAHDNDLQKQSANSLSRIGSIYNRIGEIDSARQYISHSIKLSKEIKSDLLTSLNLTTLGIIESRAGYHLKSLRHFIEIDSLCQSSFERLGKQHGLALFNIAATYLDHIGDLNLAIHYSNAAKKVYAQVENSEEHLAKINGLLGKIYKTKKEYSISDSLYSRALEEFKNRGLVSRVAKMSSEYGHLMELQGKYKRAEELLLQADSIYQSIGERAGLADVSTKLASYYSSIKNYPYSIQYYKRALNIGGSDDLVAKWLHEISDVYYANNQFQLAYDHLKLANLKTDSLGKIELTEKLKDLETKYRASQQQEEISLLKLKQSRQTSHTLKMAMFGIFLISILSILALWLLIQASTNKKLNESLRHIYEFRKRLFADISHELKTPITLIKGPAELISKDKNISTVAKSQLTIIHRNLDRLTGLVNSLNSLNRIESKNDPLEVYPNDLAKQIKLITASFDSLAQSKNLHFYKYLNIEDGIYYYNPQSLETILYNLLGNAFKYTSEGSISVHSFIEEGKLILEVCDTGDGISEEFKENVFDRFYRSKEHKEMIEGSGLGLALAKSLVDQHCGSLFIQSHLGRGSQFTIELNLHKSFYKSKGAIIHESQYTLDRTPSVDSFNFPFGNVPLSGSLPLLLIIEDNHDTMEHINHIFQEEYQLLTAQNGKDGLEITQKFLPDLVIADIMMPVMNGLDYVQSLKANSLTNHIPVILLTANDNEKIKIRGLQLGANDFLSKPFSIEEIKLRVKNTIGSMLKQNSAEPIIAINPKTKNTDSNVDQQFWDNLSMAVNENLPDSNLSASKLAKIMNMSRMQLHRKILALTGVSTSQFIRNQRLIRAASLLKERRMNISEIAYEVGFSTPNYFSTCFKELYGVSPQQFISPLPIPSQ